MVSPSVVLLVGDGVLLAVSLVGGVLDGVGEGESEEGSELVGLVDGELDGLGELNEDDKGDEDGKELGTEEPDCDEGWDWDD